MHLDTFSGFGDIPSTGLKHGDCVDIEARAARLCPWHMRGLALARSGARPIY